MNRVTQKGGIAVYCEGPDGTPVMSNYGAFDAEDNYYSDSGEYWKTYCFGKRS